MPPSPHLWDEASCLQGMLLRAAVSVVRMLPQPLASLVHRLSRISVPLGSCFLSTSSELWPVPGLALRRK